MSLQWSLFGCFVWYPWRNCQIRHMPGCSVCRRLLRFHTTTWDVFVCSGLGSGKLLGSISTRYVAYVISEWLLGVYVLLKLFNSKYGRAMPVWKLSFDGGLHTRNIILKIKCDIFLFVEVNFSTSVFNINKSIWILRKITKITNLLKKRFKVRHRRSVYIWQVMTLSLIHIWRCRRRG